MIIQNNRKVKVELETREIDNIIAELNNASHDLYEFLNYDKIVKKLEKAR